jgi:hypothetical protein
MSRRRVEARYAPGAMRRAEAAAYCGMSVDTFDRYVRDEIPLIYCGELSVVENG